MSWIAWLTGREETASGPRTPPDLSISPVDYTDGLLKWMLKQSVSSFTITPGIPLPQIGKEGGGSPLLPPPHQTVINRMKLVAGLNPVSYPEPVCTTIEVERRPHRLLYEFRFTDRPHPSSCVVNLQVRQG